MNFSTWILFFTVIVLAAFLRLYHFGTNPPALYWEETALGYDAYSILKTGKDHHGHPWPLIAFESFGDWKPSLYFYTLIPFIAILGLDDWVIRLPSALAGVFTVGLVFWIVWEIFNPRDAALRRLNKGTPEGRLYLAFFSALMLAIMPWHILVSRVGFETNLGLLFVALGLWLWQKAGRGGFETHPYSYIITSALAFGLSLYAYHGYRVMVPLLVGGLGLGGIILGGRPHRSARTIRVGLFWGMIGLLSLPIFLNLRNPAVAHRFAETSAFATLDPILKSNAAIQSDGNTLWARLLHHRYWYYGKIMAQNYFTHWNPNFLIIEGDSNRRHSVGLVGQLYWLQLPLVLAGIFFSIRNKERRLWPIFLWLLLAPLPASITVAAPHALRSLSMVVPLAILAGYGIRGLGLRVPSPAKATAGKQGEERKWKLENANDRLNPISIFHFQFSNLSKYLSWGFALAIILGLTLELTRFWDYYQRFYPIRFANEWQAGYKELIQYINSHESEYDAIWITRDQGRPAMYYWFYTQTDPREVQAWNERAVKDQGEYLQFKNVYFGIKPDMGEHFLKVFDKPAEGLENQLVTIIRAQGQDRFWIYQD